MSEAAREIMPIIEGQAGAWSSGNVGGILSAFSVQGEFIVPDARLTGLAQLRTAVEEYFRDWGGVKVEVRRIVAEGNEAVVEWEWADWDLTTDESSYAEDAIVLRVEDGKIVYWREYIDSASCFSAACREAAD